MSDGTTSVGDPFTEQGYATAKADDSKLDSTPTEPKHVNGDGDTKRYLLRRIHFLHDTAGRGPQHRLHDSADDNAPLPDSFILPGDYKVTYTTLEPHGRPDRNMQIHCKPTGMGNC